MFIKRRESVFLVTWWGEGSLKVDSLREKIVERRKMNEEVSLHDG